MNKEIFGPRSKIKVEFEGKSTHLNVIVICISLTRANVSLVVALEKKLWDHLSQ